MPNHKGNHQMCIRDSYNVNTNERLSGEFSATTGFNRSLLGKLDYFMRDRRTDQVRRMDPNPVSYTHLLNILPLLMWHIRAL